MDRTSIRKIVSFWLITRVWLSVWAVLCSSATPQTELESQVPVWPVSFPLTRWLERVFLSPWERWDAEFFIRIARQGYQVDDGTLSFHPLYPLLGRLVGILFGGHYPAGLFLVANVCGLLFLIYLDKFARLDLDEPTANRLAIYFPLLPSAFVLFVPYTESLFLLLTVLALLKARNGRWWAAGVAGGLAALTRQQGVLLLIPLAWEFWEWSERRWPKVAANWRHGVGLLMTPAGLLAWIIYRALALGDVSLEMRNPQSFFYGLLVSPSATRVVHDQSVIAPWKAFSIALQHTDSPTVIDLFSGLFFLFVLVAGGRLLWRMRRSYLLYCLAVIILSFSYSTGDPHAYQGLPRHCLAAVPLILPLAVWGGRPFVHWVIFGFGTVWLMATTAFFVFKLIWLP